MRVAKSMTPENRKLAARSFEAMPSVAQCMLWHTEVEAEPLSIPAQLLGIDAELAASSVEQARDLFRDGCVRAHRELAPSPECRYLNRLLDVPIRRGGTLLPDVEQHLLDCRFCRYAADQLGHFDDRLGVLLAEAVLGWGARRYLDSRPGRRSQGSRPRRSSSRKGGFGGMGGMRTGSGSLALLSRIPRPHRGVTRPKGGHAAPSEGGPVRTKVLVTGVGVAAVALLVTLVAAEMWSDDEAGPVVSSRSSPSATASPSPPATGADGLPPNSAGLPSKAGESRLRNVAADLCLDIRGGKAVKGAAAKLSVCTDAGTQRWSYEDDGRLRSEADSDLCLDSNQVDGITVLGPCVAASAKRGDDVRYDRTVRGELIPRWQDDLALTPVTPDVNADVVVKIRDRSDQQRWLTDEVASSEERGSLSIAENVADGEEPAF